MEECAQYSSLRAEEFQKLLVPHFAFVKDAHFQIQNQSPNSHWYSFFFREVAFYEDDGQYITENHKTVASVDGYDDLTELFKRSISPKGEIVYYPVLDIALELSSMGIRVDEEALKRQLALAGCEERAGLVHLLLKLVYGVGAA